NVFLVDVLPHIHLCPIRQGKDAHAFRGPDAAVVELPELRTLLFWIPLTLRVADRVNTLFGARSLFVPAGAAEGRVKTACAERVQKRLCLQQLAAALRAY